MEGDGSPDTPPRRDLGFKAAWRDSTYAWSVCCHPSATTTRTPPVGDSQKGTLAMSEQTTAPEEGQPANTPPEGTGAPPAETVDWEKRYHDLQPAHTQASQEAAQYRQLVDALHSEDPDTRSQAAQALGLELIAEETPAHAPGSDDDPIAQVRAEIAELKAMTQAQAQEAAQASQLATLEVSIESQLAAIDGLDEADKDWIVQRAVHLAPIADGPNKGAPDIQKAHEEFVALLDAQKAKWADGKRAPHVTPGGQAATKTVDLNDRQSRVDYAVERLTADQ